jgi:predicted oxidoreductase (fatty acid repression mutant protein)
VYPRIVVRHFEEDALIFLRNTPSDTNSKMPPAIIGLPNLRSELWNIFKTYLEECVKCNEFEQLVTTKIFSEVIIASTGTLQAFVLSLAVCVENLAGQLANDSILGQLIKKPLKNLEII